MSLLEHRILGLPLDTDVKRKLICCGFNTVGDMKDYLDVDKLKAVTNLGDQLVQDVVALVKRYVSPESINFDEQCGFFSMHLSTTAVMKSVSQILKNAAEEENHITSFSSRVDALLGGGFPVGRIIEVAGEAGLGKTQFAFQLCVDVQIPKTFGGLAAEAVFIDVEGNFIPQRVEQIADAAIKHCKNISKQWPTLHDTVEMKNFTSKSILSHIYLFRCTDSVQLMASCHQMANFLKTHSKVKLLVIDSIAHSLRVEDDYIARTKFLMTLKEIFLGLISHFDVSILILNQVTTKINEAHSDSSYNIPSLGPKWSHVPNIKLMLYKHAGKRFLYQYKSPSHPDGTAEYCVTSEGIRDPDN